MARIIATLAEWNAALGQCGCCNMPGHPEPRKECESLTGEWGCGDTEYSKAYEKWQAARDKWIEEHEHLEDPPPIPWNRRKCRRITRTLIMAVGDSSPIRNCSLMRRCPSSTRGKNDIGWPCV